MNPNDSSNPEPSQPETPSQESSQTPIDPSTQTSPVLNDAPVITLESVIPITAVTSGPKSKEPLIVILIVLLLLIAGAALYWFVLCGTNTTKTSTNNSGNSQNVADTGTDGENALAALRTDSDAAGLTATLQAYTKVMAAYRYYDKDGVSVSTLPVLTLVFSGYTSVSYSTDVTKVEQIMTDNDLSLVHGSMAAGAWKGTSGVNAYVTYAGDTVSCSGRVGGDVGTLRCQSNTKLATIYTDVEAAWTTFPSTVTKPTVALDQTAYYESTDGTVKGAGLANVKHSNGKYYDEFAVKIGSADWKYISCETPLSTSGLDPSRPCSMLSKTEYKSVFQSIVDAKGCVANA